MERVYKFLADQHWWRKVSEVGQFSIGSHRYGLGVAYAQQDVRITFDADIHQFVVEDAHGEDIRRFTPQGLTVEEITGLESGALPVRGYDFVKGGMTLIRFTYLVADTTDIGQDHRALVLSLAYHKRSLPLIWHVEPGSKGHTSEDLQVELIQHLYDHFQPEATVIFLGDSEFDGVKVQRQLDQQDWYYICRTSPHVCIHPDEADEGFPLGDLVPEPGSPERQLDSVEFTTTHRYGPVSCYACWEESHDEPLILIYHLPPHWSPRSIYKRRFWTEPLFSDCKEGGFRLSTSRLQHAERLSCLLLAVSVAYIWMVCLGVRAIRKGVADLVDRSNRRTLSIFKTGWRWFKRQIKLGRTILLHFKLPSEFRLPDLKYL